MSDNIVSDTIRSCLVDHGSAASLRTELLALDWQVKRMAALSDKQLEALDRITLDPFRVKIERFFRSMPHSERVVFLAVSDAGLLRASHITLGSDPDSPFRSPDIYSSNCILHVAGDLRNEFRDNVFSSAREEFGFSAPKPALQWIEIGRDGGRGVYFGSSKSLDHVNDNASIIHVFRTNSAKLD